MKYKHSVPDITVVSSVGYLYHDDFLNKTEFIKLGDIAECFEVKLLIVTGKNIGIDSHVPWYYLGCTNCKCAATQSFPVDDNPDGSEEGMDCPIYKCKNPKCNDLVITVTPRFKIPILVQHGPATVSFTLFDSLAHKLLDKTGTDLYQKYTQLGDVDVIPEEFNDLLDKKYAFKIEVSDYNLKKGSRSYAVKKVTTDDAIIIELEKRINDQPVLQSDSFNADFG